MRAMFTEWPDALQATLDIAGRCQAHIPMGPQRLPEITIPKGQLA